MKVERKEVYVALDGERDYQDGLWGPTGSQGLHSVTEFLVFMEDYVKEALHYVSRNAEPGASEVALNIVRKVAAMGVACMEQHGAPHRNQPK